MPELTLLEAAKVAITAIVGMPTYYVDEVPEPEGLVYPYAVLTDHSEMPDASSFCDADNLGTPAYYVGKFTVELYTEGLQAGLDLVKILRAGLTPQNANFMPGDGASPRIFRDELKSTLADERSLNNKPIAIVSQAYRVMFGASY